MFSVVRFHAGELEKELENLIHAQKLFDYYRGNLHLTDIQKAAATLVRYGPTVQPSYYAALLHKGLLGVFPPGASITASMPVPAPRS